MTSSGPLFRRAPDVRYRVLDGEAVVLRQRAAEVVGLDPVGARILDLCDGATGVEQMVETLAAEFEADRETLARDVGSFLAELAAAGLIEPVGGGGGGG